MLYYRLCVIVVVIDAPSCGCFGASRSISKAGYSNEWEGIDNCRLALALLPLSLCEFFPEILRLRQHESYGKKQANAQQTAG
jgi:hypothetical protein